MEMATDALSRLVSRLKESPTRRGQYVTLEYTPRQRHPLWVMFRTDCVSWPSARYGFQLRMRVRLHFGT